MKIGHDFHKVGISEDLCGETIGLENKNCLYRKANLCTSEESDAFSFDGSWVSDTLEPGQRWSEVRGIGFRQVSSSGDEQENAISNFYGCQAGLGGGAWGGPESLAAG